MIFAISRFRSNIRNWKREHDIRYVPAFALITPTVITYTGPTRFRYYQFWAEHLLGYVAIFYMIFVHNMRPAIKSLIKAYVALVVMAAIVTLLFVLAYLPWYCKDKKRAKAAVE